MSLQRTGCFLLFIVIIIIIAAILMDLNSSKHVNVAPTVKVLPSYSRSVYTGAWVTDFWDNKTKTLKPSNLTDFEEAIGQKVAIANIYSEWAYLSDPKLIPQLEEISSNGWTPMISSNPYFFDGCPKKNQSLYKTIASGACDEFLKAAGVNLASYRKPLFFRFAWEMNLPNMYWSVKYVKSEPQDFIDAWRHFHDIVKQESADNVIWVLSFNTTNSVTTPYAQLFPGDEYIDWVAIDGYNWGNTHSWSGWQTFNGVFIKSYEELVSLTDKPVMISEVNSAPTGTGGNKEEWLKNMLTIQIPEKFPKIEAIIFFNEDKSEGEKIDWRMEKSPEYISALKESLKNSLYKNSYP